MLNKAIVQLMALGFVGTLAATATAQDAGALIDVMVRKGMLKDQEAEQIRSQLSRDFAAQSSAGKLNLSSSVKELKLSGDVRARWQYDQLTNQQEQTTATPPVNNGNVTQRSRYRLRLRINGDYQLNDNFFAGFGLQTENKPDSGNQTMADTGATTPGGGFQNYNIYVSKAFIGWRPINAVTLIAGKQANPFYTTDMVWDADINPTGFTQRVDLHKLLDLGGIEASLVAGQFVLQDNAESAVVTGTGKSEADARDAFLYQIQLQLTAPIADGVKLTVAPGVIFNNGATVNPAGTVLVTGSLNALNSNESAVTLTPTGGTAGQRTLDGQTYIVAPGDVAFTVAGMKSKVLWDFSYNLQGGDRWDALVDTVMLSKDGVTGAALRGRVSSSDKTAALAGFQLGENKKKGDWSLLANYRYVGAVSVDPNINDSDWALSKLNMHGPKVAFGYNLGDATTLTLSYYSGNNIRKNLNSSSVGALDRNSVQVLQLDASVKF